MLKTIITHEIRLLMKSPATIFMLGLLIAAMIFGAWNGYRAVERQSVSATTAIAEELTTKDKVRNELIAYETFTAERGLPRLFAPVNHAKPRPGEAPQGTNAGAVGGELIREVAVLPPTGLSAFATGQMDLQRNYTLVDMKNKFNMSDNFEIENPFNLMVGTFDIAFVILFILPVFIIALTYDMLSGEKESGTLALAMTQPISLRTFMAAKLISRAMILMLVIVIMGLGAVWLTAGELGMLSLGDTWLRFGLWLGVVSLYSLFWFSLGVLVSAFNKNSETNATILAASWLILVVVVPALVNLAATTIYPAPSRMDLKVAQREASSDAEKSESSTTKAYYTDHVEMVSNQEAETYLTVFLARQEALEKAVEPVFDNFRKQQERQEGLVSWFQYFSPAIVTQLTLNEISGASTDRYNAYMDKVYAFHATWRKYFTPRYLRQEVLSSSEYDSFPKFSFPHENTALVWQRTAASFAGLLLIVMAVTFYAFSRLRRFGVRENP
ncbi:ABC transporter permease subunit [Govanella unica]|uniref:ABC transporter permease subunit n=1 Tax=Govanella unica TaxID=2975056 RepID=A0A9X3TWB8_9PROT|nr:ABC transporter permease subunit [Govania unica]MDA5192899.1 ABC transporter permease subunit [Govania unica]